MPEVIAATALVRQGLHRSLELEIVQHLRRRFGGRSYIDNAVDAATLDAMP